MMEYDPEVVRLIKRYGSQPRNKFLGVGADLAKLGRSGVDSLDSELLNFLMSAGGVDDAVSVMDKASYGQMPELGELASTGLLFSPVLKISERIKKAQAKKGLLD